MAALGLNQLICHGAPLPLLLLLAAGPYTGCVINPARALGPAIVFGLSTSTVLLYVAAQMAGGALAALLVGAVHSE